MKVTVADHLCYVNSMLSDVNPHYLYLKKGNEKFWLTVLNDNLVGLYTYV